MTWLFNSLLIFRFYRWCNYQIFSDRKTFNHFRKISGSWSWFRLKPKPMGHGVRIPRRSSWVILATLYLVASWSVNIMANSGFDSDDLQCPEVCSCIEQPYEGLETECTNVQNKELLRKALTGLPNKTRTL